MSTFITVLDSQLSLPYWEAIQVASTLAQLQAMPHYTAGNTISYPKTHSSFQGKKQVTETTTGATASATMIKI